MMKTPRARRATAITAAAVAVAGTVAVTIAEPAAAYSATAMVRAAADVGPVVSSVYPFMGVPSGGTKVTIYGAGFSSLDQNDATAVMFGDKPADDYTVYSDTKIVAVSPAGTGNVLVKVTGPAGTSKSTTSLFGYRLRLGAEFDSRTAKATGGAEVAVTVTDGTVGNTAAQFSALKITAKVGGLPTSKVSWLDESHVKIVLPAVTKAVPTRIQLVQDGFTGPESDSVIDFFPIVGSVTPGSVGVSGGDTIKIMGTGFGGVDATDPDAVKIGGVDATYFQVVSPTRIDAVVPAAASGYAGVTVTTPGGSSPDGNPARVAYRTALTLADGQYLRANGGVHLLTVTGGTLGANLAEYNAAAISVRMGNIKLSAAYVDPTHLRVTVPPVNSETVDVTVWQDVVSGPPVTVPVAPVVTSLSRVNDSLQGGTTVKVKVAGAGVAGAVNFMFGSYPAVCPGSGGGSGLVFTCTVPAATEPGPVWVTFTAGTGTASRFTPAAAFSYTDID